MISDLGLEFWSTMDWVGLIGQWGRGEVGGARGKGGYHCLSYFGVGGDVAVVLSRDLRFGLAEVFTGHVEGGFGHGRGSGIFDGLLNEGLRLVDYYKGR